MNPACSRRRLIVSGAGLAAAAVGLSACTQRTTSSTVQPVVVDGSTVPVGSALILADADYVVTQPTAGAFKAFSKICPHAGCPVSQVDGAQIICVCHHTSFRVSDGTVISGPSKSGLPPATVAVSGTQITVTP